MIPVPDKRIVMFTRENRKRYLMKNEGMAVTQEPPIRARLCIQLLRTVLHIPGDVIELGVCEGATTVHLAQVLIDYDTGRKRYFACDTFEGLPYSEGELQRGECESSLKTFKHRVRDFAVLPVIGKIEQTLDYVFGNTTQFCFAFLDLDLEASTRFAIEWVLPKMSQGSIIGFHDYGFHRTPGIKSAVDELVPRSQFEEISLGNTGDNIIFFRKL